MNSVHIDWGTWGCSYQNCCDLFSSMAINVLDGNFMVGVPIYDDWTHVVMNFVGPRR